MAPHALLSAPSLTKSYPYPCKWMKFWNMSLDHGEKGTRAALAILKLLDMYDGLWWQKMPHTWMWWSNWRRNTCMWTIHHKTLWFVCRNHTRKDRSMMCLSRYNLTWMVIATSTITWSYRNHTFLGINKRILVRNTHIGIWQPPVPFLFMCIAGNLFPTLKCNDYNFIYRLKLMIGEE